VPYLWSPMDSQSRKGWFAWLTLTAYPRPTWVFGICLGSATEAKLDASPDHGLSVFQRIASAGFTSVRIDAGYTTKVLGTDPCIRAAFKAGLDVLLILDAYKPSIGVAAFSAFAGAWPRPTLR